MPVHPYLAVSPPVFRRMALELPEAIEQVGAGQREFLIGGRPFAALYRKHRVWGLLHLRPEERSVMVRSEPRLYRPVPGTEENDESGDMQVRLSAVNTMSLTTVLHLAWGGRASPELRDRYRGRVVLRTGL